MASQVGFRQCAENCAHLGTIRAFSIASRIVCDCGWIYRFVVFMLAVPGQIGSNLADGMVLHRDDGESRLGDSSDLAAARRDTRTCKSTTIRCAQQRDRRRTTESGARVA